MESYCKEYMKFISDCKMEREAVKWTIEAAEKAGFRELKPGMQLKPGDRVYGNNHNKSVIFAVVGSESLNEGTHICAAHIDSPRLDLKPNPLYEDADMAYFKTHYYGGIKKYQWTTIPAGPPRRRGEEGRHRRHRDRRRGAGRSHLLRDRPAGPPRLLTR